MTIDAPAPGWFPCPTGAPKERWWDGSAWTDHERDAVPGPTPDPDPATEDLLVTAPLASVHRPPAGRPYPEDRPATEDRPASERRGGRGKRVALAVIVVLLVAGAVVAALLLTGTIGGDRAIEVGGGLSDQRIGSDEEFSISFTPSRTATYLVTIDGAGQDTDTAVADERGERVASSTDQGLEFEGTEGRTYWIFVVNEDDTALDVDITVRRPR